MSSGIAPRLGPLGRWWVGQTNLPPRVARAALGNNGNTTLSVVYAGFTEATALGLTLMFGHEGRSVATLLSLLFGTGIAGFWLTVPRFQIRAAAESPLTVAEADTLVDAARDPLERSYFRLVRDAQRQVLPPEAALAVLTAMRALGEALSQLPTHTALTDSASLRAACARAQEEAAQETDDVVAASLGRQAGALRRSADIAERSARLMRRTSVLRDELSAQIEALRLGLTSFETSPGDVSGLSELTEAVLSVASQAVALTDARAELDASLAGTPSVAGEPPSVLQMLRAGED